MPRDERNLRKQNLHETAQANGERRKKAWQKLVRRKQKKKSSRRRLKMMYINSHLFPNMRFIEDQHYQSTIPFNYIGDLKHFGEDFPQIVEPFILNEEMRRNHTKFMELIKRRRIRTGDNWDHKLDIYHIERAELSDANLENICEMYWVDYLCLPFDIPA